MTDKLDFKHRGWSVEIIENGGVYSVTGTKDTQTTAFLVDQGELDQKGLKIKDFVKDKLDV